MKKPETTGRGNVALRAKQLLLVAVVVAVTICALFWGSWFPGGSAPADKLPGDTVATHSGQFYGAAVEHQEDYGVAHALWWTGGADAPAAESFDSSHPLYLLMHGYSGDERDWPALLNRMLPGGDHQLVSLRAPISLGKTDYSKSGAAWFEPAVPDDASDVVKKSADAVLSWIDANVPTAQPIVLLGFSQGGTMVTELMRLAPSRFVAGVNLSGWVTPKELPGDTELAQNAAKQQKPKMLYIYSDSDKVVPLDFLHTTAAWVEAHGDATILDFPTAGHSASDPEIITAVGEFLKNLDS
jgi:phospholipase/carboxylesterase